MTAPESAAQFVRHNHDGGQALPFGRKKPEGECPRCDELRNGAAPREPHPRIAAGIRLRENDERRAAEIRDHFASEKHRSGGCGICCTFGDW
jgi:hypothetical protein